MSDLADDYRAMREHTRERKAAALPVRTAEILALEDHGYTVRQLTPYHFRVNEQLDLFPTFRRYHDLVANARGQYETAHGIAAKRVLR